jgi:hypothetical protein
MDDPTAVRQQNMPVGVVLSAKLATVDTLKVKLQGTRQLEHRPEVWLTGRQVVQIVLVHCRTVPYGLRTRSARVRSANHNQRALHTPNCSTSLSGAPRWPMHPRLRSPVMEGRRPAAEKQYGGMIYTCQFRRLALGVVMTEQVFFGALYWRPCLS